MERMKGVHTAGFRIQATIFITVTAHHYIPERQSFVSKIEDEESQIFKYGVG